MFYQSPLRSLFTRDLNELYTIQIILVHFSPGLGIFLFVVSKIATFTWNFTDLFVMLVKLRYLTQIIYVLIIDFE